MKKKLLKGLLTALFFVAFVCALGTNNELPALVQIGWILGWATIAALSAKGLDKLGTFDDAEVHN